jgi:hypothetical protein
MVDKRHEPVYHRSTMARRLPPPPSDGKPSATGYRLCVVLGILAPLWLCAFGLYIALRNFCEDACVQPSTHPHDHWHAWLGSAVCVGLIWGGTWVIGDWRRRESPLVGADRWLQRSWPLIFVAALAGGSYAVLAQDAGPASGYGRWAYTGGTVWLWLLPTLLGIVLLAGNLWALRREWGPMGAPAICGLLAALATGACYVAWQG